MSSRNIRSWIYILSYLGKNKVGTIIDILKQELTYMMLLLTLQVERSGEKADYLPGMAH